MKSSTAAILALLALLVIVVAVFLPKLISSVQKSTAEVATLNQTTGGAQDIIKTVQGWFSAFKPSQPGM